jgi:hypothetical protein
VGTDDTQRVDEGRGQDYRILKVVKLNTEYLIASLLRDFGQDSLAQRDPTCLFNIPAPPELAFDRNDLPAR